jgi:hypothetical protein
MNIAKHMELVFVAAVIGFCSLAYVADIAENSNVVINNNVTQQQ